MDRKETDTAPSSPPKTTGKQDRRAEALRRNLLKRKAQARAREDDSGRSD